jgi:hypothetical protein
MDLEDPESKGISFSPVQTHEQQSQPELKEKKESKDASSAPGEKKESVGEPLVINKATVPNEEDEQRKSDSDKTGRYMAFLGEVDKMRWSKEEARLRLLGKEWYSCKVCLKHEAVKDEK